MMTKATAHKLRQQEYLTLHDAICAILDLEPTDELLANPTPEYIAMRQRLVNAILSGELRAFIP